MSYDTELTVELLIPDNIAFTAFTALKRMGFEIEQLKRADYYKFILPNETPIESFSDRIKKIDILVNANKHRATIRRPGEKTEGCFTVIVQDMDEPAGLLFTLKERFGFTEIEELEKGTLWKLFVKDRETAKRIAESLLYNKHYQKYEII
jgi:phosphoribosylformylglycinamidine (FGAM) synthase PurS component